MGKEQAFSQASSSRAASPSQDPSASQGPANTAECESKSQQCKSHAVDIDLEDPDHDLCPTGQLLAGNASAAVSELLTVGYIMQAPAAQLLGVCHVTRMSACIAHADYALCLCAHRLVMTVPAADLAYILHHKITDLASHPGTCRPLISVTYIVS